MKERIYTYKFRLYPSKEQETYLTKALGCCRLVYNHFLSEKQNQYKETKTSDNYYAQQSKLTELRKIDEYGFLNEIPLQSLQCSLINMHTAYDRFYKHKDGYPNFKSKRDRQAFKLAQPNTFKIKENKLYIPKLKSGIDMVVSKEIDDKICFATISKNKSSKYYASIMVKQNYKPYVKADYLHKITSELVRNYDAIKIEDLNVKSMMKNHKLAEVISKCTNRQQA